MTGNDRSESWTCDQLRTPARLRAPSAGDLVDLDGMPDPSDFEVVEVVVDDPDPPDEPEAPWWASL